MIRNCCAHQKRFCQATAWKIIYPHANAKNDCYKNKNSLTSL